MSRALWIRPERGKRILLLGPSPQPNGLPPFDYFEPIFTTRRARPRARRLARVFLPPRVSCVPGNRACSRASDSVPVCGLHIVFVPSTAFWVVVPRPHRTGRAARQHGNISECASAGQVSDPAEDPTRPEEKLTFPQSESRVLSPRFPPTPASVNVHLWSAWSSPPTSSGPGFSTRPATGLRNRHTVRGSPARPRWESPIRRFWSRCRANSM